MPTNDTIISFALAGGLNQAVDPDQLAPPELTTAVNVVARRGGRLEKRPGYQLVETATQTGAPATAFGGSSAVVSPDVEAIGAYHGKDGARAVLAAGSRLYEYVGSDATHGWRDVNRLPSCLGTLHPVTATGGEIIEAESMLNDAGTLRCTVWIAGTRTGQERTNDSAINNQPVTAYGVYIAVQQVSDGSFVTPPTRVQAPGGGQTTQCCDLRMCMVMPVGGVARNWVISFRHIYSVIVGVVVNSIDASIYASQTIVAFTKREYHRSFDITGVPGTERMLIAQCAIDTTAAPSGVRLELRSISLLGVFSAVITFITDVVIACDAQNFVAGAFTWLGYAARGVVLETEPTLATSIGIGIRLVYQSTIAPKKLDGKMLVTRVNVDASAGTLTVNATDYGIMHRIGFKTDESLVGSFSATGGVFYSASVSSLLNLHSPVPASFAPPIGVTTVYVTGVFPDGTKEVYAADVVQAFGFSIGNFSPYKATELQKITQAGYVRYPHVYPGTARQLSIREPLAVGTAVVGAIKINKQQVVKVILDVAHGIAAAEGWVITGTLYNGLTAWCTVQISCQLGTGHFIEVAIVNGNPGNPATPLSPLVAGTQATSILITSAVNVGGAAPDPTSAIAYPINGAGAMHMMLDYLNTSNVYAVAFPALDVGDQTAVATQTYFDGVSAPEACVHRWDVQTSASSVVLAVSSTSAGVMSNPNGAPPLGYASPFAENNFFEVYEWDGSVRKQLNVYAGGSASTLWTAMGGPWRMMSSLMKCADGRTACVVSPSGDGFQQSAMLISFARPSSLAVVETPKPISGGAVVPPTAEGYSYSGSVGVFVESLNMARTASIPLNCPRLTYNSAIGTASMGVIRSGQNSSSNDVLALDYEFDVTAWRTVKAWNDYTAINGGVVTTFDGSGAGEVVPLIWPQQDMSGIAYERIPTKLYAITRSSTSPYANVINGPNAFYSPTDKTVSYLENIKRPWFAYEAGFNDAYGYSPNGDVSIGWGLMSTPWGGKATDNYMAVYTDPRLTQLSARTSLASQAGLNQAGLQHYYGRYQSGYSTDQVTTSGNERLVVWAPRQDLGVAAGASDYTATVADGDFLARWCYESVDGTGRIVRSAPSAASTFTVCARIRYNDSEYGGTIDEFRYGFFVPRMELTNRLTTATSDARRVSVQPYFSAEPFATVLYRVPFSSFLSGYQDSMVVPRNATRGVVPYSGASLSTNPNGIVTSNFTCFDGPQKDYNGLLSQPYLYTTGGVLDNVSPPSAKVMCIHQNRLILGGADDTSVIWMSKELTPTEAPGFNEALTLTISDAGAVTGLASLNGNLIIFKRNAIFVVPGVLPDSTGAAPSMGEPIKLPAGVGCIDHRSIVETPVGVFFQSERGLEVIPPSLQVNLIGDKIFDTITTYPKVVSAIHYANDQEVRFLLEKGDGTSRILVNYSYLFSVWSTHTINYLGGAQKMGVVDGMPWLAASAPGTWSGTPQAAVYRQSEVSALDILPGVAGPNINYVKMTVVTAPIDVHQVQGFQRVKRARLLMTDNVRPELTADLLPGVAMGAGTDYNLAPTSGGQLVAWTAAQVQTILTTQGRVQVEVHLREQKGQAVIIGYVEGGPATTPTYTGKGWGLAISNVALVVGLKKGLDKRILPDAKH